MSTFLNIGCGPVLRAGYVNVDMRPWEELAEWAGGVLELPPGAYYLQHDCIKDMPFDDGTVAGIVADNVLEHLSVVYGELQAFLASAWRVLEPGGYLEGVVPDWARIVRYWLDDAPWDWDTDAQSGLYERPAQNGMSNFAHGWEHKAIFDADMLRQVFERCGFAVVTMEPENHVSLRFRCVKPVEKPEAGP
jgi:predicted SAM-dependent methyltransferase